MESASQEREGDRQYQHKNEDQTEMSEERSISQESWGEMMQDSGVLLCGSHGKLGIMNQLQCPELDSLGLSKV